MINEPNEIFEIYERAKNKLPFNNVKKKTLHVKDLKEPLLSSKVFLLDAYGVLNQGEKAIDKAFNFIKILREKNKKILVLSNSASMPKKAVHEKLTNMGFDFNEDEIITSREVLFSCIKKSTTTWGIISPKQELEVDLKAKFVKDDGFFDSDKFLFLSTSEWSETLQMRFVDELSKNPRELWLGNADVVSPHENGTFKKEPGYYVLKERDELFNPLFVFGKPYATVFSYAINVAKKRFGVKKEDIVMVGDTLHTDILGANANGLKTLLVKDYGFYANLDIDFYIQKSKITPDFVLENYNNL
ncbi:MAG: HAD-IIA family hydrolase [Campylobacteraceae bacterium]